MKTIQLLTCLLLWGVSVKAQILKGDDNSVKQNPPTVTTSKDTDPEVLNKPPGDVSCPQSIFITGNYSNGYTSAGLLIAWEWSNTTIVSTANVTLDVNPAGYVLLDPEVDGPDISFLSDPTGNGVFVAKAEIGCNYVPPVDEVKGIPVEPVAQENPKPALLEPDTLSEGFVLSQNVPNPFTQSTEIAAQLPETVREASLLIQNLQGVTLQSYPITQRGKVTVTVLGGSLQAGVYAYSLIADGQVIDTKKMILTN